MATAKRLYWVYSFACVFLFAFTGIVFYNSIDNPSNDPFEKRDTSRKLVPTNPACPTFMICPNAVRGQLNCHNDGQCTSKICCFAHDHMSSCCIDQTSPTANPPVTTGTAVPTNVTAAPNATIPPNTPGQNVTGTNVTAPVTNGTAAGTNVTTAGTNGTVAGNNGTATGTNGTVAGTNSTVAGTNSTVAGTNSTVAGTNSTAAGTNSTVAVNGTVAVNSTAPANQNATVVTSVPTGNGTSASNGTAATTVPPAPSG